MQLEIVILAAGAGTRFRNSGANLPKQLAQINGETLLARAIRVAEAIAPNLTVVLGFESEQLKVEAAAAKVLLNPNWELGLASSIAIAVQGLSAKTDAVLITLADQVAVKETELQNLVNNFSTRKVNGQPAIACAAYDTFVGVPAIFSKEYFSELAALSGDQGAKKLLQKYPHFAVPMPSASVDIDTQNDLDLYLKTYQKE